MKKILLIAFAGLVILVCMQACDKEKLVTVNEPLELDENSAQYQQYMEERATQLIKEYRFDRLGNTIDRIKDPTAKERVLALLTEYRDRAFNEALYYAKPNGDTIFFFPPDIDDRKEAKRLYISNLYQKAVVNEIGILHGFKNFPKVETVDIGNSLATGIKDLNGLPELKTFNWTFVPYYFSQFYPEVELAPVPLELDFSENNKLESVRIEYVDLSNLKFPTNKIKTVSLLDAIIKRGEDIDRISVNDLGLSGVSEQTDLVLTAKNIDTLLTNLNLLNSLDISETNILTLNTKDVGKIKLNNGLKKLVISADKLTEKPTLPNTLETLNIGAYQFSDKNFSALTALKYFSFGSGAGFSGLTLPTNLEEIILASSSSLNQDFSNLTKLKKATINYSNVQTGLVFPASLEDLNFYGGKHSDIVNYSKLINLKTFIGNGTQFEEIPKLPSTLSKLDFSSVTFSEGSVVDISNITHLDYLRFYAYTSKPFTLILPPNLSEAALKAGYGGVNSARGSIILPVGSTVKNAPAWMSQYIHIGNI